MLPPDSGNQNARCSKTISSASVNRVRPLSEQLQALRHQVKHLTQTNESLHAQNLVLQTANAKLQSGLHNVERIGASFDSSSSISLGSSEAINRHALLSDNRSQRIDQDISLDSNIDTGSIPPGPLTAQISTPKSPQVSLASRQLAVAAARPAKLSYIACPAVVVGPSSPSSLPHVSKITGSPNLSRHGTSFSEEELVQQSDAVMRRQLAEWLSYLASCLRSGAVPPQASRLCTNTDFSLNGVPSASVVPDGSRTCSPTTGAACSVNVENGNSVLEPSSADIVRPHGATTLQKQSVLEDYELVISKMESLLVGREPANVAGFSENSNVVKCSIRGSSTDELASPNCQTAAISEKTGVSESSDVVKLFTDECPTTNSQRASPSASVINKLSPGVLSNVDPTVFKLSTCFDTSQETATCNESASLVQQVAPSPSFLPILSSEALAVSPTPAPPQEDTDTGTPEVAYSKPHRD
eukprot:GHVQ01006027.1.p1 GENE.GHVQ01006027.1~~GHVQ01006027.1.p1  ORF type:complete len:470 (+),score=49.72 GHVQ01006027.1:639-2048(+)